MSWLHGFTLAAVQTTDCRVQGRSRETRHKALTVVRQREDAGWDQGRSDRGDRFWVYLSRIVVTLGEGGGRGQNGKRVW